MVTYFKYKRIAWDHPQPLKKKKKIQLFDFGYYLNICMLILNTSDHQWCYYSVQTVFG